MYQNNQNSILSKIKVGRGETIIPVPACSPIAELPALYLTELRTRPHCVSMYILSKFSHAHTQCSPTQNPTKVKSKELTLRTAFSQLH